MYSFDIFYSYLKLGFQHIVEFQGYDHILFILTLCAVYKIPEWKKIVIVITAFTLGHSITLVLASLKLIFPNRHLIEVLIPGTILLSSLFNLIFYDKEKEKSRQYTKYFLGLFFGLIHGMSFSSYFTDIMGDASKIILPLFAFNVGIEAGQIFVISLYFLLIWMLIKLPKISYNSVSKIVSSIGVIVSLYLIFIRI